MPDAFYLAPDALHLRIDINADDPSGMTHGEQPCHEAGLRGGTAAGVDDATRIWTGMDDFFRCEYIAHSAQRVRCPVGHKMNTAPARPQVGRNGLEPQVSIFVPRNIMDD